MSAAVLTYLGTDQWNAEAYGSLSLASQIAAAVKQRAQVFRLAVTLRRLTSKIDNFLEAVHLALDGKAPWPVAATSDEPPTPERIQEALRTLHVLGNVLSNIYDSAKRQRLTNNSFIAGPLIQVNRMAADVLELADWVEMTCLHSDSVEQFFDRAARERENGDIYDLSQVD